MWSVRLSDSQRDTVKSLIRAQGELGPSLTGALEALDLARWDDLPEASLPWEQVAQLADDQGVSEADVVWDLAGGLGSGDRKKPKRPAGKRGSRKRAKQASSD